MCLQSETGEQSTGTERQGHELRNVNVRFAGLERRWLIEGCEMRTNVFGLQMCQRSRIEQDKHYQTPNNPDDYRLSCTTNYCTNAWMNSSAPPEPMIGLNLILQTFNISSHSSFSDCTLAHAKRAHNSDANRL